MNDAVTTVTPKNETPSNVAAQDIEAGKTLALVGYIFCPLAIWTFLRKDNAFTLYHAKQALTLLVAAVGLGIAFTVLGFVLSAVKLGLVVTLLSLAVTAALVALIVCGALNAWHGRLRPLPAIGQYAGLLFRGEKA